MQVFFLSCMFAAMRILSLIIALWVFLPVYGQKTFTMYDAVIGGYTNLAPERLKQLQWIPGENKLSQVVTTDGKEQIEIQVLDPSKNGVAVYIPLSDLNQAIQKRYPNDTLKRFPGITWINNTQFRFFHKNNMLLYDDVSKTVEDLSAYDPAKDEHADWNSDFRKLAYVRDNNLHIRSGKEEIQLTQDGGKGIVYGQSVHRNEFGISKGTFWSEDGNKLAFYRMDESMVTEYPVYNLKSSPATADMIRYPVAGAKSHHVTIGVYDLSKNKTIYLQTGEPAEQYLTNVTWDPKGELIYVAVVNRAQNHMWLRAYNATDGSLVRTLFEETHPKYVEPEHGPLFLNKNKEQFIWQSERDGYNHLYLYDTKGKLIKQLSSGTELVTRVVGIDPKDQCIIYETTSDYGRSRIAKVYTFKTGKIHTIDASPGVHSVSPSSNYEYVFDVWNNAEIPYRVDVRYTSGKLYSMLKQSDNPLKDYALGKTETGVIRSSDNQVDLVYRVVKPVDFDPSKKYPVIVYLYNGPHLQLINNGWLNGANLWYHYLAQKGFVVFSIDGRGSADRGLEFENAVFRQLGTLEMEDQLAGVNWLKQQGYVDSTRMGVHGWSYGGFMTTSLMTRKAGTFKVGVAGGPVIDWRLYEIMYTERYMDTPEENPEGYAANNLLSHIDKLKDKLLVIHGAEDDVVLWQHSLLLLEEAIKKGIQLDYFVYPHHQHNVRGKDRVHLMQKITDYLIEGLEK